MMISKLKSHHRPIKIGTVPIIAIILSISLALMLSCSHGKELSKNFSKLSIDAKAMERFIGQAVVNRVRAKDIPDITLATAKGSIRMCSEVDADGIKLKLDKHYFAIESGIDIELLDKKSLQEMANTMRAQVYYLIIRNPRIVNNTDAEIIMGVGDVCPEDEAWRSRHWNPCMTCCCASTAYFFEAGGKWVFDKWDAIICS